MKTLWSIPTSIFDWNITWGISKLKVYFSYIKISIFIQHFFTPTEQKTFGKCTLSLRDNFVTSSNEWTWPEPVKSRKPNQVPKLVHMQYDFLKYSSTTLVQVMNRAWPESVKSPTCNQVPELVHMQCDFLKYSSTTNTEWSLATACWESWSQTGTRVGAHEIRWFSNTQVQPHQQRLVRWLLEIVITIHKYITTVSMN